MLVHKVVLVFLFKLKVLNSTAFVVIVTFKQVVSILTFKAFKLLVIVVIIANA